MKTRCLGLAATILFVVPAVTNAGFIAIPVAGESDSTEQISLLSGSLDSLDGASGVSDSRSGLDPLIAYYADSDVSAKSLSSSSEGSFDPPLAEAFSTGESSLIGTFDTTAIRISEPGTLALLGIGLIVMGLLRRRAGAQP